MNNGVVLIMNQSQREYFKQGQMPNQRGIKLVTMGGMPDSSTKAKVLSMLNNERGINSRSGRKGTDSRNSQHRGHVSSRQFNGKYSSSVDSTGLGHQSTDGTYDAMHFGGGGVPGQSVLNRNEFD